PLALLGTAGVRGDTITQRPGLGGAESNVLEASEQCAALKHGAPHRRRDELFGLRRRRLGERIQKEKSSRLIGSSALMQARSTPSSPLPPPPPRSATSRGGRDRSAALS